MEAMSEGTKARYKLCKGCGGVFLGNNDRVVCAKCNGELDLIETDMPFMDIASTLPEISKNYKFIKSMVELYETDIIEYTARMNQFKQQINSTESEPRCPHCNSTNIARIGAGERAVSITFLGAFSNKINKSFKCKKCGYTW